MFAILSFVFSSFKCLTSWSDGDVKNWGSVCGFAPDSSRSWIYNSQIGAATIFAAANGVGLCNNRLAPAIPILTPLAVNAVGAGVSNQSYSASLASLSAADYRPQYNAGLTKRIQYLNYSLEINGVPPEVAKGDRRVSVWVVLA